MVLRERTAPAISHFLSIFTPKLSLPNSVPFEHWSMWTAPAAALVHWLPVHFVHCTSSGKRVGGVRIRTVSFSSSPASHHGLAESSTSSRQLFFSYRDPQWLLQTAPFFCFFRTREITHPLLSDLGFCIIYFPKLCIHL